MKESKFVPEHNQQPLTSAAGAPIANNQDSLTAGPRGPMLLQDLWFLEKLAHFDREVEKAVSVSAGIASAVFSLACGAAVHFDCRVVVAPTDEQVTDYFRWRQADATRCALNGWCYWTLRKEGFDPGAATKQLSGLSVADKNELLFRRGVNFNDLPAWQRRGTGLTWEAYPHAGRNPLTGEEVTTTRRRVREDRELPVGDAYAATIAGLLAGAAGPADAGDA